MTAMSHTSTFATSALTQPMPNARTESSSMRLSCVKSARRSSTLSLFSPIDPSEKCLRPRAVRHTRRAGDSTCPRLYVVGDPCRCELSFGVWSQALRHSTSGRGSVSGEEASQSFDDRSEEHTSELQSHSFISY